MKITDRSSAGVIKLLAVAPLAVALAVYFLHAPFRELLGEGTQLLIAGDIEGLRGWAGAMGVWAPLATSLLMIVQALAAPIPAILVTATNSLLFGPFVGGVLSIASATVAASICYLIGRLFGDTLVRHFVSRSRRDKLEGFVREHGATAVLVARLLPFVPFDPISYVAGLCRLPHWTFFWATLIGQAPAGMAYSYLAQQAVRPDSLVLKLALVFVALLVVGWTARKALLRGKLPTTDS